MRIEKKSFTEVRQFSQRDIAYTLADASLQSFYNYSTDLNGFAQAIRDRAKFPVNRELLTEVLSEQYADRDNTTEVLRQIELLRKENSYTLITAHQPSLFTGPLYYIYKIACTIQLSRKLKQAHPENEFIPVFVSGGEDHDFEEINHLRIFQKTISWEQDKQGSVGRLSTDSLAPVIDELEGILGDRPEAKEIMGIIRKTFAKGKLYGKASLDFVHELFGNEGLVVIGMDSAKLKKAFSPVMQREVFEQPSEALVHATQQRIIEAGYKEQAFARPINLFYLGDGFRERITADGDGRFSVLNTDLSFSSEEMKEQIADYPERFSPNVVMRPLYQEFTLPNLAYVGGGGELAYWLERKDQFDFFGIFFPLLMRRNSAVWVDKGSQKRMAKLGIEVNDLFTAPDELVKHFLANNTKHDLSYEEEKKTIETALSQLVEKAKSIDPTLAKSLEAEKTKTLKTVDQMGGRLTRSEKQKQEQALSQLSNLQEKLFPSDSLQERKDNFLGLYLSQGKALIPQLIAALNPLEKEMVILLEE